MKISKYSVDTHSSSGPESMTLWQKSAIHGGSAIGLGYNMSPVGVYGSGASDSIQTGAMEPIPVTGK